MTVTRVASSAKTKGAKSQAAKRAKSGHLPREIFAGLFGALLGLSFLKFGNPIRMEYLVDRPTDIWQWLLDAWPVAIGYWLLGGVTLIGLLVARWKTNAPKVLVCLPLAWLAWEAIAATQSEIPAISWAVMGQFVTCVICFYLGLFSLSRVERLWPFWAGLFAGFFIVLALGLQQHFGGLEQSRKYWILYAYPTMKNVSASLWKKMNSDRIFATLFYPNTLAGVILMVLPMTLAVFWSCRERFTAGARSLLLALSAMPALACLFWTRSKTGWLLMLVLGVIAAMYLPIQRRIKVMLIAAVLVLGLAGFFVKYAGYFKKGATSVEARFDYWQAALKTVAAKPVFGSGPGTFGKAYERVKRPESEMSLMTHNDYLEQASDSGVLGFLLFTAFIVGALVHTWRKADLQKDWVKLSIWLGVLGWALQETMEFGLYIPALGWPALAFLGWLLGQTGNQVDRREPSS